MRHPAEVEVDEHADAQRLDVDQVGGSGGCSHVGAVGAVPSGLPGYRPGRMPT